MYEELQKWFNENHPDDNLIYKSGLWPQVKLIRDIIPSILARSYEEFVGIRSRTMVVSEHTSKSVKLPVFELNWNRFVIRMRNNFYDWKVSVRAPTGVEVTSNFMKLFDPTQKINSIYCEGFKDEWVFGPYSENTHKFSFSVPNDYYLYTFFWILKYDVFGGVK